MELMWGTTEFPRWVGTPRQVAWLSWVAGAVLVMNVLDALLTLYWIRIGVATEANPLMAELIHRSELLFIGVKFAMVGGGIGLLWRYRTRPMAVVAMFAAFFAYYGIIVFHIRGALRFLPLLMS